MNAPAPFPLLFMKPCGPCDLCCKVIGVSELSKPRNAPCVHAAGRGCAIHEGAGFPRSCREFNCGWRLEENKMPENLRPDRVHAVLTAGTAEGAVVVNVDPDFPLAHTREPLAGFLHRLADRGLLVDAAIGDVFFRLAGRKWIPLRVVASSDGLIEVRP